MGCSNSHPGPYPLKWTADELSERFSRHHAGTLECFLDPAFPESFPPDAINFFEGHSKLYVHPSEYTPGNFERFFIIRHPPHPLLHSTYVAFQTKIYSTIKEEDRHDRLLYLYETAESGVYLGHGEIRYADMNKTPYFRHKPVVGFTETKQYYWRKGLGTSRLLTMNALSHTLFGFPMHSSTTISDRARRIWLHLVEEGKACRFIEDKKERFAFL